MEEPATPTGPIGPREPFATRLRRLAIVILGIVATQFIVFGPSLVGQKILLPLEILAQRDIYMPSTPETARIPQHDTSFSDLVYQFETDRLFATAELHAGRFPFWAPYQFAGAPFVWPKYSPFLLFQCLTFSPVIVAWGQMLVALTTGLGAYAFLRRAVGVSFWPSAVAAWCWPFTGFFIFWQGFPTCAAAFWLPWLLLAVFSTVRRPRSSAPIWLSVTTMFTIISGHIDVAGQTLLISGIYAIWRLFVEYDRQLWLGPPRRAILFLTLGWSFGFMLAAPHIVPLLEYAQGGARMVKRGTGAVEERPPGDISSLPSIVLPDIYGSSSAKSLRLAPIAAESPSAGYIGLLTTLFLAPLAWSDRRHRAQNFFWLALAILGLSWCIGLPGFVTLLRLPGMRMMSHNRLVFATAFAVLTLSAIGFDALLRGQVRWNRWHLLPILLLAVLGGVSLTRAFQIPATLGVKLTAALDAGRPIPGVSGPADISRIQEWFWHSNLASFALCTVGLAFWIWLLVTRGSMTRKALAYAVGIALVADMLWFAAGRNAQAEPSWYYPRIDVLEKIAAAPPGRVLGYGCLPAQLPMTHGLNDVRGYDSIDPSRFIALLRLAAQPGHVGSTYAATQFFHPLATPAPPDGVRLPPVLDLLGIRYLIFRGQPPEGVVPTFRGNDYWVAINHQALPRLFIPRRVETIADDATRLGRMSLPGFQPRDIAFIERPLRLPESPSGTAEIVSEIPTHIVAAVEMATPGLVVLADHYDAGWQAYLNGAPAVLLRTDHALRGVVVPAGKWKLEFRYEPASITFSFTLAAAAVLALTGWAFANRVAWRTATA